MHEWQVASSPQSTEASWQHPWLPRATHVSVNVAHAFFFFEEGKRVINPNDTSSFSLSLFSHRGLFNTNQPLSLSAILITFPSFVSLPGRLMRFLVGLGSDEIPCHTNQRTLSTAYKPTLPPTFSSLHGLLITISIPCSLSGGGVQLFRAT